MEMHYGRICDKRRVVSVSSGLASCVQGKRLVSALSVPEGEGKRKSTMETLSLLSAGPQLSQA